jgi:hypothetical protein
MTVGLQRCLYGLMMRHAMNFFEEEVSSSSHTSSSSSYTRCQLLSVAKQWCLPRSSRCGVTGSRPARSCS